MPFIHNPVLPGFYPDPSICRAGDDFYLVTSSFSFYPGLPVFHSRDLRHWEQLGHVIGRPTMLRLDGRRLSGGLWAPTIRFHGGLFYVICTHSDGGGDFVCTAENPAGPWSDPHWIPEAPGIDPSLFWDEDGACWMTGNDFSKGFCYIWGCRFDDRAFRLIGEPRELWRGALKEAYAPEAPHLYKKNGLYLLVIAEGGTGFFHSVTVARSEHPEGPYTGYPGNPVLTHRHLGRGAAIACAGHADLLELQDGSWITTCLASRPCGGWHLNLGRETFLAPVEWQDGWPLISPATGRLEFAFPAPLLPDHPYPASNPDDWHSPVWNQPGCGDPSPAEVRGGDLLIRCVPAPLVPDPDLPDRGPVGFLGRRQQHFRFQASVEAVLPAAVGSSCGLAVLQNNFHSLRLELFQTQSGVQARLVKAWFDRDSGRHCQSPLAERVLSPLPDGSFSARLVLRADHQSFSFFLDDQLLGSANGSFLGSETAGGFIGAYLGVFASGNGRNLADRALFRSFRYLPV